MRRLGLAVLGALALSGCGFSYDYQSEDELARSLGKAKTKDQFEPYWFGPSFHGDELREAKFGPGRIHRVGFGPTWSFSYGPCEEFDAGEYGTLCNFDVVVTSRSVCNTTRTGLPKHKGGYRMIPFRGARATWNQNQFGTDVLTGGTIVTIEADTHREERARAEELRPISSDEPVAALPPPVPGSLEGRLPCQQVTAAAERERRHQQGQRKPKPQGPPGESLGPYGKRPE